MRRFWSLAILLPIAATLFVAAPAPPTTHAAPAPSVFGFNSHIASRYPEYETLDRATTLARDLRAGWVREDVHWYRIEAQPGRFDWSWYDRVFDLHRRNGVQIIGVLGPAVGWATPFAGDDPQGVSFYAPDPDRFAQFAARVAARYRGQVAAWEIWNEPENGIHWQPAPDPAAYTQLLIKASAAIKAVDPNVTVLNGGVVPFDPWFLEAIAQHGGWHAFDALSVHPYVDPFAPEAAQIDLVGIRNVQNLAAKYGAKPIWVTEFGWGSGACERDPQGRTDEQAQANYLVRGATLLRGAGAERVLWYNYKDQDGPCYGLVRRGGGPTDYSSLKPAAIALKVLSEQVGGATPRGALEVMPRQTVLTFDDAGGWGAPFPPGSPAIAASATQVHSGVAAGQISYRFTGGDNEYVAYPRAMPTPLPPQTTRLGLWVYGDGSGHMLQVRVEDQEGHTPPPLKRRGLFLAPKG